MVSKCVPKLPMALAIILPLSTRWQDSCLAQVRTKATRKLMVLGANTDFFMSILSCFMAKLYVNSFIITGCHGAFKSILYFFCIFMHISPSFSLCWRWRQYTSANHSGSHSRSVCCYCSYHRHDTVILEKVQYCDFIPSLFLSDMNLCIYWNHYKSNVEIDVWMFLILKCIFFFIFFYLHYSWILHQCLLPRIYYFTILCFQEAQITYLCINFLTKRF